MSSGNDRDQSNMNRYWIPGLNIHEKVITEEIPYCLGPDSNVSPLPMGGKDGYLIVTPGECLSDEQIDDICTKSSYFWQKEADRLNADSNYASPSAKKKYLKRPLNKPVVMSRASGENDTPASSSQPQDDSRSRNSDGSRKSNSSKKSDKDRDRKGAIDSYRPGKDERRRQRKEEDERRQREWDEQGRRERELEMDWEIDSSRRGDRGSDRGGDYRGTGWR